ncbi:MAG: hypothetical protein ABR591_06875 [Candidatus Velthaea sp.]
MRCAAARAADDDQPARLFGFSRALVLISLGVYGYDTVVEGAPEWVQDVVFVVVSVGAFRLGAVSTRRRLVPRIRAAGWRPGPSYVRAKIRRKANRADVAKETEHE